MINNVVLDVFIGLIFVFLLYSLLATIIQELIASRFGLRARMLQKALRRMLEDGDDTRTNYTIINYWNELADNISRFFNPFDDNNTFLKKFYSHPSIKYLGEGKLFKKPSYLHAHNFSQTIIHLLRGENYDGSTQNESSLIKQSLNSGQFSVGQQTISVNPQTLKQLNMLFADARQDSFVFKHKLEDWFEETMDRTTGWYKKQTQLILILIGFFLAWTFNVDTIAITKILMKDKKAREQLVELAISRQKEYGGILDSVKTTIIKKEIKANDTTTTIVDSIIKTSPSDKFIDTMRKSLQKDAMEVQGILGLSGIPSVSDSSSCSEAVAVLDSALARETDSARRQKLDSLKRKAYECCLKGTKVSSPYQKNGFLKFIGWLLTALAVSLGAPFWFDLLNKFIKLREAGPKAGNMSAIDSGAINNTGNNPIKDNTNSDIRG
jgi:hypothetical protein